MIEKDNNKQNFVKEFLDIQIICDASAPVLVNEKLV